ncbi:GNAT family N-acetyltransferase [Clostridium estertheticum]|uniref:GNAT family N-acetyltransferase n=1 Tax=Clostridium estertheticum TaxID=238834 RepID=UPI001CF5746D|nr:GNAT family N-acetyltransferase [Clostridium estertheticum]MCB2356330.1 GNAT family N-acetyltransferase [Clostridium estertheticum]WAG42712.1 GNAT family N-acetyltransferase [Clostridium estertheticum]
MEKLEVRRFDNNYAAIVSKIICRNFLEVNIRDYSKEDMKKLSEIYNPDKVKMVAGYAHMYVFCLDKKIIACGAISNFWGKEDESILLTIFVLPELQGKGVGRTIIETLENDKYFLRAKRIEIPASITARGFYKKLGYDYKDGVSKLDDEGHYRLEKFR